ncbi:hypothetical protein N8I77_010353 [Diaporthe amygdali]|uniref:Uncharacterized protein n=1 Tax=Phomopsis amygdali TaxID=1214568 RepID=A0AAD9S7S1_PHOAM|nr:hypothetical protein N8I77_010353 [Diaporthe amygdali]
MVLPEISSPQGRSASVPDQSTSGGAFPFEPSNSQGASSSRQSNDNPQPTSAHAGAQASDSHNNDGNQSKSVLADTWDGLIFEKPTSFPLSEIVDLRPMHYSDHLYAYTRSNGRSGFIMDSLLEDFLMEKGFISASKPEPNAEGKKSKEKGKGKVKKQDGPRVTTAQDVAAATGSAKASEAEAETAFASQTFQKVCDDLQTFIELLDTSRYDEGGKHQTKVCIDAIKAVSERAKELGKQPLKARVAAPSAVDPETHCAVPRPAPWKGELCGRELPCVAHSNREYIPENPQLDTPAANVHSELDPVQLFAPNGLMLT